MDGREPIIARRWLGPLLALVALALLPWTVWLTQTLPSHHEVTYWRVVWSVFDGGLIVALSLTAYAAWRRLPWLQGVAAAAGTMLLCDAWFDSSLEFGRGHRFWYALAQAVLSELPLALLCFWIARDTARFFGRWESVVDPEGHGSRLGPRAGRSERPGASR